MPRRAGKKGKRKSRFRSKHGGHSCAKFPEAWDDDPVLTYWRNMPGRRRRVHTVGEQGRGKGRW